VAVVLSSGCGPGFTDAELAVLEAQGAATEQAWDAEQASVAKEDPGPITPLMPDSYHNWLFPFAARGVEQGTHGTGPGECLSGYVVVGIQYHEHTNDQIDGVGMLCRNASGVEYKRNWYETGPRGPEHGSGTVELKCPAGAKVIGIQYFEGGWSDWVDGVGIHCQRPDGTETWMNWLVSLPRGPEQGTHGTGPEDCPDGQAVVGVQYFEGGWADWVDGVGMHCKDIAW
jgi:hypothetical protein